MQIVVHVVRPHARQAAEQITCKIIESLVLRRWAGEQLCAIVSGVSSNKLRLRNEMLNS